jgi:hypothetical protein
MYQFWYHVLHLVFGYAVVATLDSEGSGGNERLRIVRYRLTDGRPYVHRIVKACCLLEVDGSVTGGFYVKRWGPYLGYPQFPD